MRLLPPKPCVNFCLEDEIVMALDKMEIYDYQPYTHGQSSLIYLGKLGDGQVIIKTPRKDKTHERKICLNEGRTLEVLNRKGVGPELICYDRGFVVMKYFDGIYLNGYISSHSPDKIKKVLTLILSQLFVIDSLGIDKRESQRPDKHIIIGSHGVGIIDFEKARSSLRPRNVSGFIGAIFSNRYQALLRSNNVVISEPRRIYELSRKYVDSRTKKNFDNLVGSVIF
jgi:putative serine/threonine protein kinase